MSKLKEERAKKKALKTMKHSRYPLGASEDEWKLLMHVYDHMKHGRYQQAIQVLTLLYDNVIHNNKLRAHICSQMSFAMGILGLSIPYKKYVKEAWVLDKTDSNNAFNMAVVARQEGDRELELAMLEESIHLDRLNTRPWAMVTEIKDYNEFNYEWDINVIKKLLTNENLKPEQVCGLHYALSNIYDKVQQFDKAFEHMEKMNETIKTMYQWNEEQDIKNCESMKRIFTHEFDKNRKVKEYEDKPEDFAPVLIVGSPRSGTTLVETMLASHEHVSSVGETNILSATANRIPDFMNKVGEYDFIKDEANLYDFSVQSMMTHLAVRSSEEDFHDPSRRVRVLDKQCLNHIGIGLFKMLHPNGKILWVRRRPEPVIHSMYKTFFAAPNMSFTNDLEHATRWWKRQEEMMRYWQSIGVDIMEVQYEELVNDPKDMLEHMLQYLQLPYDENCLNFHENKSNVISNLNAYDVRQPVYAGANAKCEDYKPYMGKVEAILNE